MRMKNKDWYNIGEQIKDQVQSAIESNDFGQLNDTINKTINDAMSGIGGAVNGVMSGLGDVVNNAADSVRNAAGAVNHTGAGRNTHSRNGEPGRPGMAGGLGYGSKNQIKPRGEKSLLCKRPSGEISGVVYMAIGFSLAGVSAIFILLCMLVTILGGAPAAVIVPPLLVMLAGLAMGLRGGGLRGRAKRFRRYTMVLKGRMFCSIEELAMKTGKSRRFIVKDLRAMFAKNMFLEGHLDKQESCLIVSDQAYDQYRIAQRQFEMQQNLEQKKTEEIPQAEEPKPGNLTEMQKIVEEGNAFIKHIRECNNEIPGATISSKLDKLELVVTRIFAQVQKDPSLAPELHKMMNYYLPTTEKLIETYCELDKQPIEGQNIADTKREIEATLDTINGAFETFLDNLFRDQAWDIQSDISVLQTMLKQDGYIKSDFEGEHET